MKRLFNVLIIVLMLLSFPINAQSKWSDSEDATFNGQMGRVDISVSYDVDLSGDVLVPGWSDSRTVDVTNTGTIPLNITGVVNDAPSFMTVTLDVPTGVVLPGGVVTATLTCSISPDLDQSFEDSDAGFTITFTGEQL